MSASNTNPEPIDMLVDVASGRWTPAALSWLQQGAQQLLEQAAELRFERYLRLPTTTAKMRMARRNYALRHAWNCIDAPSPWLKSVGLAAEVKVFAERVWPRWRDLAEPPAGCSELRRALFHAFKPGKYVPETAQGLDDIVRG